jgi:hypothetical protein
MILEPGVDPHQRLIRNPRHHPLIPHPLVLLRTQLPKGHQAALPTTKMLGRIKGLVLPAAVEVEGEGEIRLHRLKEGPPLKRPRHHDRKCRELPPLDRQSLPLDQRPRPFRRGIHRGSRQCHLIDEQLLHKTTSDDCENCK